MANTPATLFRTVGLTGAALLFAGLLAGCPDKKPKHPNCASDKDCQAGEMCVNKQCVQCATNDDCPDGQTCDNGACKAEAPECTSDEQCLEGKVCKAGACVSCADNSDCGPGGSCNAGACTRATKCTTDDECADDEDCLDGYCQKPWKAPTADGPSCTLETVYFAYDSDAVAGPERDKLDRNASCVEKESGRGFSLIGHTDASGTDEYNIALSERRARSAADYMSRLGVDPGRLQIVPKGETEVTGVDDKDRRVEAVWN